ncbi:hypothetical protein V6N13_082542 [Hibiscus sabdariffa]
MHWDETFPESFVHHLLRMESDHRPLLLHVGPIRRNHSKPQFRYFTGWQLHDDFRRLVTKNWHPSDSLSRTINSFSKAGDLWNATVFGFIRTNKRTIMARRSTFLIHLENELLLELESLIDQEEMLQRQKSCLECIHLGDRNMSYFHKKAKIQKVRNRITSLQISDGTWRDKDSILKGGSFAPTSMAILDVVPSSDEIHAALMDIVVGT